MNFSERLKIIIDYSGLKRDEFAHKCEVSRAQLFKYLKGDQEPGTGFYRALKLSMPTIDIGWLISGMGNMLINQNPDNEIQNSDVVQYEHPIEAQHMKLIKEFKNKKLAFELNIDLVSFEQDDPSLLYEIKGYFKRMKSEEKKTNDHMTRTGEDRRKNKAS